MRAWLRARDPRVLKVALSLAAPFWLVAVLVFVGNFSADGSGGTLIERFDPMPFGVALILTALLVQGVGALLGPRTAAGKSLEELQAMPPDLFEDWVAERFRDLGYTVRATGREIGGAADHGVDLLVERPGELAAVQCKWARPSWPVEESTVRDLLGSMRLFGTGRAYIVTTRLATQTAWQSAEGNPIEIWDGEAVARLSREMAASRPT